MRKYAKNDTVGSGTEVNGHAGDSTFEEISDANTEDKVKSHPPIPSIPFKFSEIQQAATVSNGLENTRAKKPTSRVYPHWFPVIGDSVEYTLYRNTLSKQYRACDVRLIAPSTDTKLYRGVIRSYGQNYGFVQSSAPIKHSEKPEPPLQFNPYDILGGEKLQVGDEVEYRTEKCPEQGKKKVIIVRLVKSAPVRPKNKGPVQVDIEALNTMTTSFSSLATQKFTTAKGPDDSKGFKLGRGRNLPVLSRLSVSAKEWHPGME
jgi:hypothetical protein